MERPWRAATLFAAAVVCFSTSAEVQVCKIKAHGNSQEAIVIRSGKQSEFFSLINAKEYAQAMLCCTACMIPAGTKIVITDRGWTSHTIRVLEGTKAGCVGDIPMEFVGECQ
jgi:hypothetical protein